MNYFLKTSEKNLVSTDEHVHAPIPSLLKQIKVSSIRG